MKNYSYHCRNYVSKIEINCSKNIGVQLHDNHATE